MATDMAPLQAYVEPDLLKRLKYIGVVEGRSMSDIVRQLATTYVEEWRDENGRPAPTL